MAKANRYWRCYCTKPGNTGRITVKSGEKQAPLCKGCGNPMKREGATRGVKQGKLKAKPQVGGRTINITASSGEELRQKLHQVDLARRNKMGLPWEETPISWPEAARIYTEVLDREQRKNNITSATKRKYIKDLNVILGYTPQKKERWKLFAHEHEMARARFYRELKSSDPTASDIRTMYLHEVAPADVNNFLLFLKGTGMAITYANQILERIRAVYRALCRDLDVAQYQRLHNARIRIQSVTTLRTEDVEDTPRLYSAEEIDLLLKFYEPYPEWHFVMFIAVKLMLRITAIRHLKVSNFDFNAMTLKTPRESKGGKVVTIPIPESVKRYVEKWMEDRGIAAGWLLRSSLDPTDCWKGDEHVVNRVQMTISKTLEAQGRYEDAARFKALTVHKIGRHTGASIQKYLMLPYVEPSYRSAALTHSDYRTTLKYAHDNMDKLRALTEAYDKETSIPGVIVLPPPPHVPASRKKDQSQAAVEKRKAWQVDMVARRDKILANTEGRSTTELAVELGVSETTVLKWKKIKAMGGELPLPKNRCRFRCLSELVSDFL